jgi:hypothetical protein
MKLRNEANVHKNFRKDARLKDAAIMHDEAMGKCPVL